MKKIFIVAIVLIMVFNFYCNITHQGDQRTPYSEFKTRIDMAPMKEYQDPDFGYVIKCPCFFQKEDTSLNDYQGYARFSFTDHVNVILESYVTMNHSSNLEACADSLARELHAGKTMLSSSSTHAQDKKSKDSAFILSGPVYENGVRIDGYSHYDKFIKSGKMLFAYPLTYPDSYKPAMPRLFKS